MAIDWKIVRHSRSREPIGALGFIGDEIAVVTAFFEDKDWNRDGRIDLKERFLSPFTMKGKALAEVASQAYADPDILVRDPSIQRWRGQLLVQFANGMLAEGVYKAYFSMAIGKAAGAVAGAMTQHAVKAFVVKKGLEKAVQEAYRHSVHR